MIVMRLSPLGPVLHVTPSKLIVVKLSNPKNIPKLGVEVVTASGELVGVLMDIIGPVDKPFAVVKPRGALALSLAKPSVVLYYRVPPAKKPRRRR